MTTAYLFAALGLLSFAAMGIVHKIGDRLHGQPLPIALYAMVTAAACSALRVIWTHALPAGMKMPPLLLIALPFGVAAGLCLWFFQTGLRHGSISTSWLIINLSAGVPAVLSILVYHEVVSTKKAFGLALMVISLLLLWWDRRPMPTQAA